MVQKKSLSALVLSGGGARGAYEAGILHYLRSVIVPKYNLKPHFDIYCGSSVGAINTCYLASLPPNSNDDQKKNLYTLWQDLKQDEIYLRDASALSSFLYKSMKGITLNFLHNPQKAHKTDKNHFGGFFDTKPFPDFLKRHINFEQLNDNIESGPITAVALTATNATTDIFELFINKKKDHIYTGPYILRDGKLGVDHPRASAAIPIVFPPVKVGKYFYIDGGLHLNTPMSPAIQLGADKIFIIGLHNEEERLMRGINLRGPFSPPSLGEVIGKVFNAIFLDRVQYDLEQMARINRITQWGKMRYGDDFIEEINRMLREKRIRGDIADRGLKNLNVFSIFPSQDIREIFQQCISDPHIYKKYFGAFEKMFLKVLDVDLIQGQDFLSYLMFLPNYLNKLLELGFKDAKAKEREIATFMAAE